MARKNRVVRRVDERNDNLRTGGGDLIQIGSAAITAPGIIQPPEPDNVTIGTQVLLRTTYTPKVAVNVSWGAPANLLPQFYLVEYAEDVNFTTKPLRVTTSLTRVALEMKPNTDYWIRVKAMIRGLYSDWAEPSSYPSVSVHTIGDTTPPDPVTGVTTSWVTGDLEWRWTNPSNDNFFQTRLRIYDTNGGTLYKEVFIVGNPGSKSKYTFTADENSDVTAGAFLKTVYYELLAYSLVGIPAVTAVTGTVTKSPPAQPTGVTNTWTGDNGTYDEGVTIAWNAVTGATSYKFIIDGVTKETARTQYTYSYSENVSDHRPTLVSGDFALSYTVQARDPLNQLSPGASGTATNLAPSSSNLTLTTVAGFSSLYAYITPTSEILDLYAYRWTLKSGGVNIRPPITSFTPEITFTTLYGNYVLEVYAIDKFGRNSATLSGAVTLDGLTIEQLRSSFTYTSSDFQIQSGYDALKDSNYAVAATGHLASATDWRWIKGERALVDRYKTISFGTRGIAAGTLKVYFGTSVDDITYRWFAGPLVSTGSIAGTTTFTEYASEALAQTNALTVTASTQYRFDLPAIVEARFVKLGHRNTTGNYNLGEFYPRRLLQSDDIEAESLKSINIAAGQILADHITVTNLGAITANIGQLVIDTTGYIWQGTGTAASPTTGLKLYQSAGIGKLTTYNAGVVQIELDTDGRLKAGAGNVVLGSGGIYINSRRFTAPYTPDTKSRIQWRLSNSTLLGYIENWIGIDTPEFNYLRIVNDVAGYYNQTDIIASDLLELIGSSSTIGLAVSGISMTGDVTITDSLTIQGPAIILGATDITGSLTVSDDVTIGDALTMSHGNLTISEGLALINYFDATTATAAAVLTLRHQTSATPTTNYGTQIVIYGDTNGADNQLLAQIVARWTDAIDASRKGELVFFVADSVGGRAALTLRANGTATSIGVLGSNGSTKLTISGTRTGTLAQLQTVVASMLAGIAAFGFWTDNTS